MDLSTALLVVGGIVVGVILGWLLAGRRTPHRVAPTRPPAREPMESLPAPGEVAGSDPALSPEPTSAPALAPASAPTVAPMPEPPGVRPPRVAPPAYERTTLRALVAGSSAAEGATDDATASAGVARAIARSASGGTLIVEAVVPAATAQLAALLLANAGDRSVLRVAPPGRYDRIGARGQVDGTDVHEPFAALVAGLPGSVAGVDALLVEDAERHLHRGLDAAAIDALRRARPDLHVVLTLGPQPAVGAFDDALAWLRGLGDGRHRLGPSPEDPDPALDEALAALARDAPLAVDLIEAVGCAVAAGRLPQVPTAPVLRIAAALAGGDADAPVTPAALADVLRACEASDGAGTLLSAGGTQGDGPPTTLCVAPRLVARCAGGLAELPGALLGVLVEGDVDDVELLTLARVLAGADDPRPALPVLDRLAGRADRLGTEGRLLRGVVRDRLGRDDALADYRAVAEGSEHDLAMHATFLAGGVLEVDDEVGARDAYARVVSSNHPSHAPMAAFNLAWLEERRGDAERAVDAYRELAGGAHADAAPLAALNLAALLQRMKRFAEAESWYRSAVDSGHADAAPMAAVALGLMLERRQRPREARALFRYAASTGHEEAAPAALRRLGATRR